jgi:hypothetical protein
MRSRIASLLSASLHVPRVAALRGFALAAVALLAAGTTLWMPAVALAREPASKVVSVEPFARGLLWRVAKEGVAPSYVFGTIHLPDPRVSRIPPGVGRALGRSSIVLTEIRIDMADLQSAAMRMFAVDGGSLRAQLGAADFGVLSQLLAPHGLPPEMLDRLRPFSAISLLIMPRKGGAPLDLNVWQAARAAGVAANALETADEQFNAIESLGAKAMVEALRQIIRQNQAVPKLLEDFVALYRSEDTGAMLRLFSISIPGTQGLTEVDRRARKVLLDDRNSRMIGRMQPHLARAARSSRWALRTCPAKTACSRSWPRRVTAWSPKRSGEQSKRRPIRAAQPLHA